MGLFVSVFFYFRPVSRSNQEDLRAKTLSKTLEIREKSVFLSVIPLKK